MLHVQEFLPRERTKRQRKNATVSHYSNPTWFYNIELHFPLKIPMSLNRRKLHRTTGLRWKVEK